MRRRTTPAEPPTQVLDPERLRELAQDTSAAAAEQFASAYAALLPARVDRVIRKVGIGNRHQAVEAVLSLKAASSMAGALRMSQLCRKLEQALVIADMAGALAVARDISLHLPDLHEALAARPPLT
ncbi:Hpt domain-containing protein [Arthrobacter globiformis]|uniref:Hpt domain-containing protein n=1 Tax=Arthrobacter globiformis TaxID=1665 RepID=UPI00397B6B4C